MDSESTKNNDKVSLPFYLRPSVTQKLLTPFSCPFSVFTSMVMYFFQLKYQSVMHTLLDVFFSLNGLS